MLTQIYLPEVIVKEFPDKKTYLFNNKGAWDRLLNICYNEYATRLMNFVNVQASTNAL